MSCAPIPFKLVTITSGITELDLATLPVARAITRGALIDRHFNMVMIGGTPFVILDFVAVIYLGVPGDESLPRAHSDWKSERLSGPPFSGRSKRPEKGVL